MKRKGRKLWKDGDVKQFSGKLVNKEACVFLILINNNYFNEKIILWHQFVKELLKLAKATVLAKVLTFHLYFIY